MSGDACSFVSNRNKDEGKTRIAGNSVEYAEDRDYSDIEESGYKLVDTADNTKSIVYSVKNSKDSTDNMSECDFYSEDLGATKKLGIYVTQEDWNAAPPSDYSDVLVFTANTVKNEEEGLK